MRRSRTVRFGGALGSENVGMSNRNAGEIPAHRKPKVSAAMVIIRGLGGPKVKPRGVADGHSVNTPILPFFAERATKFSNPSGLLDSRWRFDPRFRAQARKRGQDRRKVPVRRGGFGPANFPEKPLKGYQEKGTVP